MDISVQDYYDNLIEIGNDPVLDGLVLREHMDKWDGELFISLIDSDNTADILEIGVGTGRVGLKVVNGKYASFTGIDISPKTIERAKQHFKTIRNCNLIADDFLIHNFDKSFDVIYSTLTFLHLKEKHKAVAKIASLLKNGGRFIVSIDKNKQTTIDNGYNKIQIYPDDRNQLESILTENGLKIYHNTETEYAYIIASKKLTNRQI